ncbi:MAG: MFS transporter [Anaerolineae bacterium]
MKFFPFKLSLFFLWTSHLFMDFFTGIWPIYKTLAHVDIAKAGLIAGISGFIGELLQIVFGYLCDRGHRKKVMLLGLLLASSILWVTFVEGITPYFTLLLLLMIGSGAFHPAAAGMAGNLSKDHKGKVILFFASGGAIGLSISQITFTKLLTLFNGHAAILLLLIAFLLLSLFLHKFPSQAPLRQDQSLKDFFQPIMKCKRQLRLLYLSQVTSQALFYAFIFLLPDLLRAKGAHGWLCWGGGHFCFMLSSALAMVPAGYLCDRLGQKTVLLSVLASTLFFFYLFLLAPFLSLAATIALLSILGAFLGLINPIIISWGNRLVPESPSTVSALLMGLAWCLAYFGPISAGFMSKYFVATPYVSAISILGLLLVINLFLVFLIPHPEPILAKEEAEVI